MDKWQSRAARARQRAADNPAVSETLHFYAALAESQAGLATARLDDEVLFDCQLEAFAAQVAAIPPSKINVITADIQRDQIAAYWNSAGREPHNLSEVSAFLIEAALQALAPVADKLFPASPTCPFCSGPPMVALLREEGHGARRSLVCPICTEERPAPRVMCIACGESRFDMLPVFTADAFPAVRLDACETCQTYIKTIDLTRDGHADAIVDDLASVALDLWARSRGYSRVRPNLLRL